MFHGCYGWLCHRLLHMRHLPVRCATSWLAGALITVLLDVRARRQFLTASVTAAGCDKLTACSAAEGHRGGYGFKQGVRDVAGAGGAAAGGGGISAFGCLFSSPYKKIA